MEVGTLEAKNRLSALLDAVERGEEVVITRRGRPVARLTRAEAGRDRARALRAADAILGRRGATLGEGLTIRDLVEDGRR